MDTSGFMLPNPPTAPRGDISEVQRANSGFYKYAYHTRSSDAEQRRSPCEHSGYSSSSSFCSRIGSEVVQKGVLGAQELTVPEDEECKPFRVRYLVRFSDVENRQGERS